MVFPRVFLWILDPVARHGRRPQGRRVGALRQGTAFSHEKKGSFHQQKHGHMACNETYDICGIYRHLFIKHDDLT